MYELHTGSLLLWVVCKGLSSLLCIVSTETAADLLFGTISLLILDRFAILCIGLVCVFVVARVV